ncbi:ABC transporter permease [Natronincola ferrireducens]|nr:ABC transporter permease [Natronincola ferrireducens]
MTTMYSKIAVGNVKKSFKDYAIYFLTLTLAVCIFYSFNSIESQSAIIEMQKSGKQYTNMLIDILGYVSVFVSVILGSLILYANNFLIKKRKKELGIYMTLGMGKSKISRILVTETILVGVISLVSGLLIGIVVSQGLSVLTSKLFEVGMSEYSFIISTAAMGKTIFYFGIMFLLVIVFNTFVISKYKIIDLLIAGRKNEDIKFKNPIVYLIGFLLCVVSLTVAYKLILEVGLDVSNSKFLISIILGIIGTILFFFSLAGFILFITKRNKKIYFKDLNIFIVKQLNSKVNTNFLSMSIICLMLFFTIGILSTGISFKSSLEAGLEQATPFDASARNIVFGDEKAISILESLNNIGFKFDNNEKYTEYAIYKSEQTPLDMFGNGLSEKSKSELRKLRYNVDIVKLSEYNDILNIQNKKNVILRDDEALLLGNIGKVEPILKEFLNKNNSVKLGEKELVIKNKELITDNLSTDTFTSVFPTLVVNDKLVNDYNATEYVLNINYSDNNKEQSEEKYYKLFEDFRDGKINLENIGFVNGYTKIDIYNQNKGLTTTILFVGIYLGLVFLITSMAVLSLQQLSEASDSIDRYKAIKKIGASEDMIKKTIFTQTLVYFSLPILLALVHSIVGIKVANDFISMFNEANIVTSSIITSLILVLIYGGYFVATYSGYKNIVKNNI